MFRVQTDHNGDNTGHSQDTRSKVANQILFIAYPVERVTYRYQWARVLVSNALSIPVDSLIFVWLAFGGTMPVGVVWSIFFSNIIIKGLTALISLPGIYLVPENGRQVVS